MRLKRLRIVLVPLLILFLVGVAIPVSAMGAELDWAKKGSISVTFVDGDIFLSGAEVTLYKVAAAESRNSNLDFAFTDDFQGFGGKPEALQDRAVVQSLADYAVKNNLSGISSNANEKGCVHFEGLSLGLYLVVQSGSVQGYSDCSPFLVSIPTGGADGWIYDIDATPKIDSMRLIDIAVKKVWNDGGQDRPESVTVQLLRGDTVTDTVILNEQNEWSYTWTDQPKSDAWSVKEVNVPKGYTVTYQKNGFVYTITNTTALIQTGQLKWPIPVLAGAGLLLFAVGWVLYFRGKRRDQA